MDKLSIQNEMRVLDRKERNFYDDLSDEEKKKFSPYLMLKYGASVEGSYDMQSWYLLATNERVNRHFFDVSAAKHKKLLWLTCTTISPDCGTQRHYWLSTKKSTKDNAAIKFLKEIYPNAKDDEIELLAELNTKQDLKNLARDYGWDDKRIKSDL